MRHFYRIGLLHCFVRVLRELVVSYQALGSFPDPRRIGQGPGRSGGSVDTGYGSQR